MKLLSTETLFGCMVLASSQSTIPDTLGGAFVASMYARFDNVSMEKGWQRFFDFSNGPMKHKLMLIQLSSSKDMSLLSHQSGSEDLVLVAKDAIVEGEVAHWTTGVDPLGFAWIAKNGEILAGKEWNDTSAIVLERMRERPIGWGSQGSRSDQLDGDVFDFSLVNFDGSTATDDIANTTNAKTGSTYIDKTKGAFVATMSVRFNDISNGRQNQRVFDFGDGDDNFFFGQWQDTSKLHFGLMQQNGVNVGITTPSTIVEEETAEYTVGIDPSGLAWISKNGDRLIEQNLRFLPKSNVRAYNFTIDRESSQGGITFSEEEESVSVHETQFSSSCAALQRCFLRNLLTKAEIKLNGSNDSYCPADAETSGWSIRCESDSNGKNVDTVKYMFDNVVFNASLSGDKGGHLDFYMGETDNPTDACKAYSVDSVPYLMTAGDKQITVEGMSGGNSCFISTYALQNNCHTSNRKKRSNPRQIPPQMKTCSYTKQSHLEYEPDVPFGWMIEGVNPLGKRILMDINGSSPRQVQRAEEQWWRSFDDYPNQNVTLRFINFRGVAGPNQACTQLISSSAPNNSLPFAVANHYGTRM